MKAYDRAKELHYADARSFVCKAMALEGSGRSEEALAVLETVQALGDLHFDGSRAGTR